MNKNLKIGLGAVIAICGLSLMYIAIYAKSPHYWMMSKDGEYGYPPASDAATATVVWVKYFGIKPDGTIVFSLHDDGEKEEGRIMVNPEHTVANYGGGHIGLVANGTILYEIVQDAINKQMVVTPYAEYTQ
jgi:hypothetical protein